jgi:hypothetical protein
MAQKSSSNSPTATIKDEKTVVVTQGQKDSDNDATSSSGVEAQEVDESNAPRQPSAEKKEHEFEDVEYTKDFGIIPMPARLQYHPNTSFHFGLVLQIIFGFASTFGA